MANKSIKRQARDEAVNAMADAKSSNPKIRKDGKYEAKKSLETISGAIQMNNKAAAYMSASQERKDLNKMPGAYKQMSKSGTFLTQHMSTPLHMGGSKSGILQTKQGYNARLDETLGSKNGKESKMTQSMEDRRDESKGMEKSKNKGAYSSDYNMS